MKQSITWLLILVLAAPGCKRNNMKTAANRVVVPVTIVYDAANYNAPTAVVTIRLGNGDTSLTVLFDTGSPGLRLLKGAIRNTSYVETNMADTVFYGTPPTFFHAAGKVCKTTFSMGSLSTASPIVFQAIDATQYSSSSPWASTGDSAIIAKNNFRGLCGIMGVGMRGSPEGIVSPLAQLPGDAKYIIRFPAYGGTSGSILLNPTDDDIEGFTLFQLSPTTPVLPGGLNAWQDMQLYGCFTIGHTSYWAYAVLDTGNPNTEILSPVLSNGVLQAGDSVTFGLADTLYAPLKVSMSFKTNNPGLEGQDRVVVENDGNFAMNYSGIMPYFKYDVLYDQRDGIVGLKAK